MYPICIEIKNVYTSSFPFDIIMTPESQKQQILQIFTEKGIFFKL